MIDLLESFSIAEILIIAIGLLLSFKGAISFIAYFKELYDKKFNKDHEQLNKQQQLINNYEQCKQQHQESLRLYNEVEEKIDNLAEVVNSKFNTLESQIENLTTSDMLNIKYDIVRDYHFFKEEQQWIDDYNLDTLERRFGIYQKEGGNSYVEGLMHELRALPKHPPLE